jgi:hypothetical protein
MARCFTIRRPTAPRRTQTDQPGPTTPCHFSPYSSGVSALAARNGVLVFFDVKPHPLHCGGYFSAKTGIIAKTKRASM